MASPTITTTIAMIYAQLPLNCRFVPVNIEDEVFQTIFMVHFPFFLEAAANLFMEMVDGEGVNDETTDGDVLFWADWAKRVYANKVRIEEHIIDHYKEKVFYNKHYKRIIDNVSSAHIGFEFGQLNPTNVNDGIELYNKILRTQTFRNIVEG